LLLEVFPKFNTLILDNYKSIQSTYAQLLSSSTTPTRKHIKSHKKLHTQKHRDCVQLFTLFILLSRQKMHKMCHNNFLQKAQVAITCTTNLTMQAKCLVIKPHLCNHLLLACEQSNITHTRYNLAFSFFYTDWHSFISIADIIELLRLQETKTSTENYTDSCSYKLTGNLKL